MICPASALLKRVGKLRGLDDVCVVAFAAGTAGAANRSSRS